MFSILTLKLIITVVTLLFLVLASLATLRGLDKLLGVSFKEMFKIVSTSPIALAIYLGFRLLAVFLVVGLVLCLAFVF